MSNSQEPYVAKRTPNADHAWGYRYNTFTQRDVTWYPLGCPPDAKWWRVATDEQKREYIQADLNKRREVALTHKTRWAKAKPVRTNAFEVVAFRYPSDKWDTYAKLTYHGYYSKEPLVYYIYVGGFDGWSNKTQRDTDELGALKIAIEYLQRAKKKADKRLEAKLRKMREAEQDAD